MIANSQIKAAVFCVLVASGAGAIAQKAPDPVFPAMDLGKSSRGAGIIAALGNRLPQVARFYGMSDQALSSLVLRNPDLHADRSGRLHYACEGMTAEAPTAGNAATNALLSYPSTQTFQLHSKPGLTRVIYLDFNGHTTSGTPWNSSYNGGAAFTSPAYDTEGSPTVFSEAELANIQEIWKRVSEDYAAWDVDVTTEEPPLESLRKTSSTDNAFGVRLVIGGSSYSWFGAGAGGVAYLGCYTWNTDTPAFIFTEQLGNGYPKYVAEAASHEAGHTVALNHDGKTDGTEYYQGHGNWAPIMGVGYYAGVTQFSRGEYPNANNTEDDTTIINSYIPRSPDLAGDDILTAVPLSGTTVSATGLIQSRSDADLYRINSGAGTLSFNVTPASPDSNLDLNLALYDGSGNLLTSADPASLEATLTTVVTGGTYYLAVDGTGSGSASTGYTDYGSLGQFSLSGTVPAPSGQPPVAAVSATSAVTGLAPLNVTFSSAGSNDPDGSALSYDWDFGDGTLSSEPNPSHVYGSGGPFTASLVVFDETGLSGSASIVITVQDPSIENPDVLLHVSWITMSKKDSKRGTQAQAVVTVKDSAGNLKPNASVTGTWSGLTNQTSTAKTNSAGNASFSSGFAKNSGTFTFTVKSITLAGATYDPSTNVETTDSIVK